MLPSVQFNNNYPNQPTGTRISSGKVLSDMVALDLNGNPVGTLSSPTVMTTQGNALGLQGQSFIATSGHLNLTLAGNMRVVFSNPANSGVMTTVSAIAIFSSAAAVLFPISYVNPTTGVPTKAGITGNILLGGPAPKSTIVADTSLTAISGGTPYVTFGIPQGRTVYSSLGFFIPSGYSLGLNIPGVGVLDTEVTFYFNEV